MSHYLEKWEAIAKLPIFTKKERRTIQFTYEQLNWDDISRRTTILCPKNKGWELLTEEEYHMCSTIFGKLNWNDINQRMDQYKMHQEKKKLQILANKQQEKEKQGINEFCK